MHFWAFGTLFKQNWSMTLPYKFFFLDSVMVACPLKLLLGPFYQKKIQFFFQFLPYFQKKKRFDEFWSEIQIWYIMTFVKEWKWHIFFIKMALKHWGDPLCVLKWSNPCKESKKEKKITSSFSFNGCTQWLTQVRGILRGKSRFLPNELLHLSMLDTHH